MSKYSEPEITEGWMQDPNKFFLLKKKDRASSAIACALSFPTVTYIKVAYGLLTDFAGYLVHSHIKTNEDILKKARDELRTIGLVLYGVPEDPNTQKAYSELKVKRIVYKRGIFSEEAFTNLPLLAMKMQELFEIFNEYAQLAGFGSAKSLKQQTGADRMLEDAGLSEEDFKEDYDNDEVEVKESDIKDARTAKSKNLMDDDFLGDENG